ncbi:tetratricopeptide repeat-containing sensor histidine kinase [Tamlana crocina]|uniref:Tetratricopeptide repeat protein n=1 Tax=Tamlana crocina TaxID=393006 RepID=A0ABX1DBZ0_9FLAO|nr:sensor histidine kinase [Tamlana crocina]NJX15870.1 tetratricopeptide repeat protein [Tamlana crocina]
MASIFCVSFSFSQGEDIKKKVDSLKRTVISSITVDTLNLAAAHYYVGEWYRKATTKTDSANYHYYKAGKLYSLIGDKFGHASALYGIANIQRNEKDFMASEVNSIEAISMLEQLDQTYPVKELKSFLYNNLGILFNELEQYEQSIKYHKNALSIKQDLKGIDKFKIYNSLNNIGYVYKNIGKYKLALEYFNEILKDEQIIEENPEYYATTLANYAHTLYLSEQNDELPRLYFRALELAEREAPNGYVSIIINHYIAEYYNDSNQKTLAKKYAYRAKNISEQYHNDDLLKSLLLLSEIEEGENATSHLKAYIKLSDSLKKNERAIRNKSARIRFETDQIEKENIQIAKERAWLLVISIVIIIASFLLYVVVAQRNKNKELQFIQKQQETNEEIYNLMLSQNESIEEARTLEKKRISEELHDGVLGRLFGARLSLDSLNMNNTVEAIKTRGQYISELKNIEDDIRKVSHELNTDFVSGSGFIDIIKTLVETQTAVYGLNYNLEHDDDINWDSAGNKMKIHIYRIIQETLHNIYKHANATHVNISFRQKNNVICLSIIDDGDGFDVNKAKSGIGLKNINSRIKEINGTINITSEKNTGTTVIIEAPIP